MRSEEWHHIVFCNASLLKSQQNSAYEILKNRFFESLIWVSSFAQTVPKANCSYMQAFTISKMLDMPYSCALWSTYYWVSKVGEHEVIRSALYRTPLHACFNLTMMPIPLCQVASRISKVMNQNCDLNTFGNVFFLLWWLIAADRALQHRCTQSASTMSASRSKRTA